MDTFQPFIHSLTIIRKQVYVLLYLELLSLLNSTFVHNSLNLGQEGRRSRTNHCSVGSVRSSNFGVYRTCYFCCVFFSDSSLALSSQRFGVFLIFPHLKIILTFLKHHYLNPFFFFIELLILYFLLN